MKLKEKLMLDIVMMVTFFFLMKIEFTGMFLHEILGVAFLGMIGVHIYVNRHWVTGVWKGIQKGKITKKTKNMVEVNIYLSFLTLVLLGTSILISNELVPNTLASDYLLFVNLHIYTAYVLFGSVVVHLILHRKMIQSALKDKGILQRGSALLTLCSIAFLSIKGIMNPKELSSPLPQESNQLIETDKNVSEYEEDGFIAEGTEDVTKREISESELEEFLSQLICTACSKKCPATALQCHRGNKYVQNAIEEYEQL